MANSRRQAVADGELDVKWARLALRNSYKMRMKMGLFDPAPNPYKNIGTDEVGSAAHQEMSLNAALKGMVLLKRGSLPFPKGKRVAVVGNAVSDPLSMTGNYNGPLCPGPRPKGRKPAWSADCWPSIGEAVNASNTAGTTTVVAGTSEANVSAAVAAVKRADFTILVIDNFADGGGEGRDRGAIGLAAAQLTLATAVLAAAAPSNSVVLVTLSGGLISLDGLKESAPAILSAGMPGVHGGAAIASTVFGGSNPGGKLPATMYHSNYTSQVDFLNMSMVNGVGRSYKYYTGTPLFPFGFGLSFTEFGLRWAGPPPARAAVSSVASASTNYSVTVTNIGKVPGDEVVLAFTVPKAHTLRGSLGPTVPIEQKKLFGFQRVSLDAGASTTLSFELTPAHLAMVNQDGHTALHNGEFSVVFTRGHGGELVAPAAVQLVAGASEEQTRVKTFRKWW